MAELYDFAVEKFGTEGIYKGNYEFILKEPEWINYDLLDDFSVIDISSYIVKNSENELELNEKVRTLPNNIGGVYMFFLYPKCNIAHGTKILMYSGRNYQNIRQRVTQYFSEWRRINRKLAEGKVNFNVSEYRPYVDMFFELYKNHVDVSVFVCNDNDKEKIKKLEQIVHKAFVPPLIRRVEGESKEDKLTTNLF